MLRALKTNSRRIILLCSKGHSYLGEDQYNDSIVKAFEKFKNEHPYLFHSPNIQVYLQETGSSDSLKTANYFKSEMPFNKLNTVATFNDANPVHPGGSALYGSCGFQEEALFRDSLLFTSIDPQKNSALQEQISQHPSMLNARRHIPYFGGIYSPAVPATKNFNERHHFVSMSVCDLRPNSLENTIYRSGNGINWKLVEARTKQTLRNSLISMVMANIDDLHGEDDIEGKRIDTINLGALGCKTFQNDPKRMAQWVVEVLKEPIFKGVFTNWLIPQGRPKDFKCKLEDIFEDQIHLRNFEDIMKDSRIIDVYSREAFKWAVNEFGQKK